VLNATNSAVQCKAMLPPSVQNIIHAGVPRFDQHDVQESKVRFADHSEAIRPPRLNGSSSVQLYMIGDGGWRNAYRPYWRNRPRRNGFLL
jgi:hypothetical protein